MQSLFFFLNSILRLMASTSLVAKQMCLLPPLSSLMSLSQSHLKTSGLKPRQAFNVTHLKSGKWQQKAAYTSSWRDNVTLNKSEILFGKYRCHSDTWMNCQCITSIKISEISAEGRSNADWLESCRAHLIYLTPASWYAASLWAFQSETGNGEIIVRA